MQWRNNLKCGARPALEDRIGKEGVDREGGYDRERGSGKRGRIGYGKREWIEREDRIGKEGVERGGG